MTECAEDGRKCAAARVIERPVLPFEPRPDHPDVGMRLEDSDESVQRPCRQPGIGIERQHERAAVAANRDVRRGREAEVAAGLDDFGLRETLAHDGRRPVGRGIVDHDHLQRASDIRSGQRIEALRHQIAGLVADYGDVNRLLHPPERLFHVRSGHGTLHQWRRGLC